MAETLAGSGADGSESPTAYSSPLFTADPPVDGLKPLPNLVREAQFALSAPEEDVKTEEYVLICFPRHCFNSSRFSLRRKVQVQGFHFVIVHNRAFDPISSWAGGEEQLGQSHPSTLGVNCLVFPSPISHFPLPHYNSLLAVPPWRIRGARFFSCPTNFYLPHHTHDLPYQQPRQQYLVLPSLLASQSAGPHC